MEEQELVERCKQGDRTAQAELYQRTSGRLMGLCVRYVGNREAAEDVLHDGFVRILSSFHKFEWRGPGSLQAWMDRVMTNMALQYLRRTDAEGFVTPLEQAPQAYEEPDAGDIELVPNEVLMRFVAELPQGYRTVLNLYVFEGKSHKEIAKLLGINEHSSASQLTRAKASLAQKVREWLKKYA